MPKIAAALAVFLTVVTCIGYNTARYPVVWEMVVLSDGFTRSRRSEPPAPFPESADSPQSEGLATATSPDESAPRWRSDWSTQEDSETAWDSPTSRPSSSHATYHDGGSPHAEDDSFGEEEDASDASEGSYYAGGDSSYTYDSEGSSYGGGGSSYASDRSSYGSEGSSSSSGDAGDTDYGYSYGDDSHSYGEHSHGDEVNSYDDYDDDRSGNSSDYSAYADESKSYDDATYSSPSDSDADKYSGHTCDGSSGGGEDWGPPQAEDRDAATDQPADRVAMRPKRDRNGAWNDAGTQYAVDPVAPLQGSGASDRQDDYSGFGAGDTAEETHVDGRATRGPQRAADPPGEPVEATAGGKYASGPGGSPSASWDGYSYSPSYSGADSYSAGSTISATSGGLTDSAGSGRSAGSTVSTGSTPAGAFGESTADAAAESTLVPIQPARPSGHRGEPPGGVSLNDESTAVASGDCPETYRVKRLPPVDRAAAVPGARPLGPHDALPVYPSTGVE